MVQCLRSCCLQPFWFLQQALAELEDKLPACLSQGNSDKVQMPILLNGLATKTAASTTRCYAGYCVGEGRAARDNCTGHTKPLLSVPTCSRHIARRARYLKRRGKHRPSCQLQHPQKILVIDNVRPFALQERINRYKRKLSKVNSEVILRNSKRSTEVNIQAANRFITAAIPELSKDQKLALKQVCILSNA